MWGSGGGGESGGGGGGGLGQIDGSYSGKMVVNCPRMFICTLSQVMCRAQHSLL